MPSCSTIASWKDVSPPETALPMEVLGTLNRLAATAPAGEAEDLAQAWVAEAAKRLPVRALHLALREGDATHTWSSPGSAPPANDLRQIQDAIDATESSVIPLADGDDAADARVLVPFSSDGRTTGALVADTASSDAAAALGALETVRWTLGLRLAALARWRQERHEAAREATRSACEALHRCETLTDLFSHLLAAVPELLRADWAAMVTCDRQGRVLHVTSLDEPDPLGPEGWARVARAAPDGRGAPMPLSLPTGPSATAAATAAADAAGDAAADAAAWALPLCCDKGALRYVLAFGGDAERVEPRAWPLLEELIAHAKLSLACIVAGSELRLALDTYGRVTRITQMVASLNQGESPERALSAVMDTILRETPGLIAAALHLCLGEGLVHERSTGPVPPSLCRGAGLTWWQERLIESITSQRPGYWRLPEPHGDGRHGGHDSDVTLITIPVLAGDSRTEGEGLGVMSLFTASLETVDVILRATLSPFAHITAQLIQNLQRHRALERVNRELEQRKAQIIESKSALEAILEGFPDGLFIVDRDLRVTLSNDVQTLRVQGSGPATGQYCWELFGSGGGVCRGCRVMDTLRKGISTRRRMRVRRPGQPEREWEVATHPVARRAARSSQAALVVVRDVTEQEQVAKSLAQVEKLAAVGRLAAGIAHEINNPLAAIQANAQLLLAGATPGDEQHESLTIVERSATRARRVVRNLLSFSEQALDYLAPVDVNASILAALDLVSPQARQNGVTLDCRLADGLPQVVAGREQLESVWLNLALNALDAVLEAGVEGRIEVTSGVAPDGRVRVTFRDNGPGIPPNRLSQVFEPFGSNASPTVGTGLGLFSCHTIVKRHGGSIRAGTGEGGGSLFEVLLPAIAEDDDTPAGWPAPSPRREGAL